MEVIEVDTGERWTHTFTCERCATVAVAGAEDLEADEFKVSGYHFDGTARCVRRLYVVCPTCSKLSFLDDDTTAGGPVPAERVQRPPLRGTPRR